LNWASGENTAKNKKPVIEPQAEPIDHTGVITKYPDTMYSNK
jgi:hypothetical protein